MLHAIIMAGNRLPAHQPVAIEQRDALRRRDGMPVPSLKGQKHFLGSFEALVLLSRDRTQQQVLQPARNIRR